MGSYGALEKYFLGGLSEPLPYQSFHGYLEEFLKWNQKINLTSYTSPEEIIEYHLLDSLALLPYVSRGTLLDIGSGGGLPGLPLAIARDGLEVTLAESIKKKADFLKSVVRRLRLANVTVINETISKESQLPEFDTIVTRATIGLMEFIALAKDRLNASGQMIAMKGLNVNEEIDQLKESNLCEKVNLTLKEYKLPYSGKRRTLVIARIKP